MSVLAVTALAAVLAGFVGWGAAHRWPLAGMSASRGIGHQLAHELHEHPGLATVVEERLDPETTAGLALGAAGAVVIIGLVSFGVLLFMVRSNTGIARLDLSAARFGAHHATPFSTHVLRILTQLGGAVILVPLTAVVALILAAFRRPGRREIGAVVGFFTLTVGGQYLVVNVIKWLVDRARPDLDRLTGFSGPSFPSGHAAASAATFAAFALVIGRGRSIQSRSVLAGLATGLAVGIAASRVMLGVHWMTDVLAGLVLGWAWFAICAIAFGGRMLRFGAPVVTATQDVRTAEPGAAAMGDRRGRTAGELRAWPTTD